MDISVKNSWPYKTLVISANDYKINSGLLDKSERLDLTRSLINSAYDLIDGDNDQLVSKLSDILNENF